MQKPPAHTPSEPASMNQSPILRISGVRKRYSPDTLALDGVDLDVAQGEIVCLLGPSGCGKTTLLRVVAGLETPDDGSVRFKQRDLSAVPVHQRRFGFMFQDFALFPHKSVAENVAFGLYMEKLPAAKIETRVAEMLRLVGLHAYADRSVFELSGGERQRVALARSLAPAPQLLMLDEPLGSLDRTLREELMMELRAILKRVGVTALYVTHDQEEAYAVGDRIAIMLAGEIVQIGAPQAVYRQPANRSIARFLGFSNILPAQRHPQQPGLLHTAIGDISHEPIAGAQSLDRLLLLIRPESARIDASQPPDANQPYLRDHREANHACLSLTGYLSGRSFRGSQYRIALRVPAPQNDLILTFDLPAYQSSGDPGALHPVELPETDEILRLTIYPDLITVLTDEDLTNEKTPDHKAQRWAR